MANEKCAACGAMIALVGRVHRCIPIEPQKIESVTYRYRKPDERRAYMRDYMKRRRAKKSGAANG